MCVELIVVGVECVEVSLSGGVCVAEWVECVRALCTASDPLRWALLSIHSIHLRHRGHLLCSVVSPSCRRFVFGWICVESGKKNVIICRFNYKFEWKFEWNYKYMLMLCLPAPSPPVSRFKLVYSLDLVLLLLREEHVTPFNIWYYYTACEISSANMGF